MAPVALLYERRVAYLSDAVGMRDRDVRICKRRRTTQKIRQRGGEGRMWRHRL